MSAAFADDRLFDVVADVRDVEALRVNYQRLRDQLADEIGNCDEQLHRLGALAHALRELAGDRAAAATATALAEHAWSGTGEQLVATARAVLTQEQSRDRRDGRPVVRTSPSTPRRNR
jgi:hypothetical protein